MNYRALRPKSLRKIGKISLALATHLHAAAMAAPKNDILKWEITLHQSKSERWAGNDGHYMSVKVSHNDHEVTYSDRYYGNKTFREALFNATLVAGQEGKYFAKLVKIHKNMPYGILKTLQKRAEYRPEIVVPTKIEMALLLKPEKELEPSLGPLFLERQILGHEVGVAVQELRLRDGAPKVKKTRKPKI